MLQYIFFIYNSTIKEYNEDLYNENYCIVYQKQENNLLERDWPKKISNSKHFDLKDIFVMTRTRNNIDLLFHPYKKSENMFNETESLEPLDISKKAIDLTQKIEHFSQNNTRVKSRARKMTCIPFHPYKKPKIVLDKSERSLPLKVPNEVIDLTQDSEESTQNDMLEDKSEKSLPENNTSTLQILLEIISKYSDAENKEEIENPSDPLIIKDPFNILATQILKIQNKFLENNKNEIFYNSDVMQKFKELQESFQTQNLKMKITALNFFIGKEFVYDKKFIINFFKTHSNFKQERKYNNSRNILYRWEQNTRSILFSSVPILQELISKLSLEAELKEYLLDYIEFIKIRLEHISKLIPNHRLQSDNSIILLYWYMRFTNENNILDNLFGLVGLQVDFFEKKIALLLSNENFIAFNNCLTNYFRHKELHINVCINHTMFVFIKCKYPRYLI